jgi:lysophospholipase L1-like esterase
MRKGVVGMRRWLVMTVLLLAGLPGLAVPEVRVMLLGDWPLQRLALPLQQGVLDAALHAACAKQLDWHCRYAGVPGPITYLDARLPQWLDRERPQCVVLGYGQMDLILTPAKTDPAVFEANLRKTVGVITAHPTKPAVLLLTCPPFRAMSSWARDAAYRDNGGINAVLARHVNAAIRAVGQELKLPVLDLARDIERYGVDRIINGQGSVPNGAGRMFFLHQLTTGLSTWGRAAMLHDAAAEAALSKLLSPQAEAAPDAGPLPAVPAPPYVELTLLGDSVTALSLGMPVHTGSIEDTLFTACGSSVLWSAANRAQGGEAASGALKRITAVLDECRPQYITVSYGLNDMGLEAVKKDPAVFAADLRALLTAIRNHPAHPQVLLLTSTPFRDDLHAWKADPVFIAKGSLNATLDTEINAATRRLAAELDLPLFDLYRLFMANDHTALISKDGVHPNTEGGKLLAETLPKWIAAYYNAHARRDPAALAAEAKARALVKEADATPANARALLRQAAESCPYLAEVAVRLDALR